MIDDDAGSPAAADGGRPLSVGYFCPGWPPEGFANGIVTYVAAIADGMTRLGHRPRVLAAVAAGGDPVGDPPVIDLAASGAPAGAGRLRDAMLGRLRPGSIAARTSRVARGLRRSADGLDVLEIEESLGLPASVAGRVPAAVVARLHGPWFLNGPNQGADPDDPEFARRVAAEGRGLALADAVTAPSRDVLERTRARYGLPLERAEAIPNPVRLVPPEQRWRVEDCEPEHVLFVGRFDRHKGGDTIIDAFARLRRDRPGARLTFVGPDRGLERDGRRWSLPEYVEARLPGALADGRVRWLDRRPPAEVAALRRRAAATVVASRYETFAITITEAMAAASPLAATRAGGAAELFEHGAHGLYAEPDDPDDLAEAIAALLADPVAAEAMGRRAAAHCAARYAPEVVAARTAAFYRRALAETDDRRSASGGLRP